MSGNETASAAVAPMRMELPPKGAVHGHVILHGTLSPDGVSALGFSANVLSSLLFQRLQPQGSHIIITIDEKNARANILCRKQDDGLPMLWDGKQANTTQLQEIAERIRNKTFLLEKGIAPTAKATVPATTPAASAAQATAPKQETHTVTGESAPREHAAAQEHTDEEESYLVKQLHRIP